MATEADKDRPREEERQGDTPTIVGTYFPMSVAFETAEAGLGVGDFRPGAGPYKPDQESFLDTLGRTRGTLSGTDEKIGPLRIASVASHDPEEVNDFLSRHGASEIKLPYFSSPDFGVAAVTEILVNWLDTGDSTTLRAGDSHDYPAVRLKDTGIAWNNNGEDEPVLILPTRDDDYTVRMSIPPPDAIRSEAQLMAFIEERNQVVEATGGRGSHTATIIFPKVDLEQVGGVEWLNGTQFYLHGTPGEVKGSGQKTIFKLNEEGAYAKQAVSLVGYLRSGGPREIIYHIDRPFVVWIQRDGMSIPVFAAQIGYSDWKDPGSLPKMTEDDEKDSDIIDDKSVGEEKGSTFGDMVERKLKKLSRTGKFDPNRITLREEIKLSDQEIFSQQESSPENYFCSVSLLPDNRPEVGAGNMKITISPPAGTPFDGLPSNRIVVAGFLGLPFESEPIVWESRRVKTNGGEEEKIVGTATIEGVPLRNLTELDKLSLSYYDSPY